jgi:3D (Asp-Asp-Asp) domain-containing protein
MRGLTLAVIPIALALFASGCVSRPLPEYEKPIARAQFQTVRTTAYTHTESDHIVHGRRTALGTSLKAGAIASAAADWSRWPAGTIFRILETGEVYRIDDYGWALSGTNTIDLYKSSPASMRRWGVRRVTIENLCWGDPEQSLAVLRPRSKFRHVKRMLEGFDDHYPSPPAIVQRQPEPTNVRPVQPASRPARPTRKLSPFYSSSM